MKKLVTAFAMVSCLAMSACAVPGEESRPDVYDQSQVNQTQNQRVVDIVSISPARINVQNEQNHETGQLIGGLLGAAAGVGGGLAGGSGLAAGLAGAAGTAGGAWIGGHVVRDHAIVSGVTVTYNDPRAVGFHSSTQVGKPCEYKIGPSLLVLTSTNETRVQPNSVCPTKN